MAEADGTSRWLSPGDAWPQHSNKEAQKALRSAKQAGFSLLPTTNHAFGWIKCLTGDHKTQVLSTSGSGDGSQTAKVIRDEIRQCKCGASSSKHSGHVAELIRLGEALPKARRLLEGAEGLVRAAQHERRSDELLGQDDDDAADMADGEEKRARVAENDALIAVSEVQRWERWPPSDGAAELLAQTRILLADAETTLALIETAAGTGSEQGELRAELDAMVARHEKILADLAALG